MAPAPTTTQRRTRECLECGYTNVAWATSCTRCKRPLRHVAAAAVEVPAPAVAAARHVLGSPRAPTPYAVVAIGIALAPVFGLTPILRYMGWFLTSLVHEIGHCVAAWVFGSPAYPAIRIDGHAARPRLTIVTAAAVVLYPLLAFTQAHDLIHLLAGHLGELAFGGIFLYRALSGGFTESTAERITYATVGALLVGKNIILDIGLISDASARLAYAGNGSFGLTQDFIRAARQLGWTLEGVGGLMLCFSLVTAPLVYLLWWARERSGTIFHRP